MDTKSLRLAGAGALCATAALALLPVVANAADEKTKTLNTVIVVGQRLIEQAEEEQAVTPGGVTLVDAEDLHERSVSNLSDLLRYVPGIWAESGWGSDELFFSSRGSNLDATDYDKNGIKLFHDGLPVTTADGNNHNRVLDPLSARSAVIARGANSLTYGASTLGGAFDFVSPTAQSTEALSIYLTGGSHGLINSRVTASGVSDNLDGLITVEGKQYDGYRDHSEQRRSGIYANAGWHVSESVSTRVFATYIDNNEELPRALSRAQVAEDPDQAAPSAITGDNRKDVQTARVALKTTWEIDGSSALDFGISYEDQSLYHPIVDVRGPDPDGDGPQLGPQFFSLLIDTDHRTMGGMIRYKQQMGAHNLVFGLNYGDTEVEGGHYRNLFGARDGLWNFVAEYAQSIELFAVDRWQIDDAWTLVYGAQFIDTSRDVREIDVNGVTYRNQKGDYWNINPRMGLVYALSESNDLFASVSRLFEAPTTFELIDDARGTNELLEPMEGIVGEVGMRGFTSSKAGTQWRWELAAYYAAIDDEILSVEELDSATGLPTGTSLSANVESTIHAGIEALVSMSFTLGDERHRLEPLISLTLNEFTFDSDPIYGSNDLPAAPKYAARGEIMYRHSSGFYAGPTFDFIGSRYADFMNTYEIGLHELFGVRGGFSAPRWEVFGEVRNALDEKYIATVSVRDRANSHADVLFPGAPRSAYVGFRWAFD